MSATQPADSKPRRAAGEDPAKREQILAGAEVVFSRLGFDAASMNDITREAGVSKSTIYVYFANKEELFEALVSLQRDRIFGKATQLLELPGSPREILTRYGMFVAKLLCSERVIRAHRIVIGVTERKPQLGRRFFQGGRQQALRVLGAFLKDQVARGTMEIEDIDLAASQFSELCLANLFRRRLLDDMPEEPSDAEIAPVVSSAVAMFLKFYGVERGG
ncbi:TetR/AcrR family transcriptional regulator [Tropicimonas isoalkanivorans]|uniref:Transcriptional regulator, TetR family n=1 Tax=Tropicimonas isoalkanivorans TaxID=441112 RepID=A0A1I1HHG8_9RHOB|nr:TetR/AcrR family transcriptional regulator [Tropicimonas isoalkanivorans]SFC23477.1 transcriptional regulator, TetR family [Tropicimonas isoalkanivorans]